MSYVIPEINAGAWLFQVADLFSSVVNAILNFPILRFFLGVLLFALIIWLFFFMGRTARK